MTTNTSKSLDGRLPRPFLISSKMDEIDVDGLKNSRDLPLEIEEWKNDESFCLSRSNTSESLKSLSSITSSTASTTRAKSYFCDYDGCKKAFTRPSLLTEHQQTVHQGIKPFKCELCGRSFSRKNHLERHIHAHSENKPLSCSFCQKGFTTGQQLKRHEITHTKSFKCPYEGCQECFYKHPQLRSHIMAYHEKNLACKVCGKEFQRPYRLRNHMAKHHNPEVQNPYQCSHGNCTSCFKTWSQLQAHIKKDHPKLRCPVCDKPCVGDSGLRMHMKVHDENLVKRNWKCDICVDVSFAKKSLMLEHYAEKHTEKLADTKRKFVNQLECQSYPQDEEEGVENTFKRTKKRKINELGLVRSEALLESCLTEGKGLELLLNSMGRKFKCTFEKCYRTFKTEERYQKHIDKHKIHQLKLKVLQEKTESKENKTQADPKGIESEDQETKLEIV